ncbi:CMP-N-acetylneuraminic acid synthetase [Salinibacter ruber]|uniref:CMP-N-acetylneuraminic acid synthetase n=1 Tax=Salinibacter ruber TaxID=146919 RepID=A0A9X2PXS8_9BACT|nr:CMP-N-acetylneuraminic acid synthetase [Salinibacter ruber]MCS3680640.1 CMP-N-acetylneuraminic acid synthetase [Salinibacter ruber]
MNNGRQAASPCAQHAKRPASKVPAVPDGKSLAVWTIEAGHESEYLDRLILSSDDEEIISVAEEYGCEVPFRRPAELVRDDTPSMDALLHALEQVESHDYVVLLQPTSPLRAADDIDTTIVSFHRNGGTACVSVTETDKPPQWVHTLLDDYRLRPVLKRDERANRRQDAPRSY